MSATTPKVKNTYKKMLGHVQPLMYMSFSTAWSSNEIVIRSRSARYIQVATFAFEIIPQESLKQLSERKALFQNQLHKLACLEVVRGVSTLIIASMIGLLSSPCWRCARFFQCYRVILGHTNHRNDPASVFLSTHWWSQHPAPTSVVSIKKLNGLNH